MFFKFIPVVGYQGTVLPALFVGMIGAKLEQRLRKVVPDALDLLLTPFLVFLIMSTLGLFIIGPVFHSLETYILKGTEWILATSFWTCRNRNWRTSTINRCYRSSPCV